MFRNTVGYLGKCNKPQRSCSALPKKSILNICKLLLVLESYEWYFVITIAGRSGIQLDLHVGLCYRTSNCRPCTDPPCQVYWHRPMGVSPAHKILPVAPSAPFPLSLSIPFSPCPSPCLLTPASTTTLFFVPPYLTIDESKDRASPITAPWAWHTFPPPVSIATQLIVSNVIHHRC